MGVTAAGRDGSRACSHRRLRHQRIPLQRCTLPCTRCPALPALPLPDEPRDYAETSISRPGRMHSLQIKRLFSRSHIVGRSFPVCQVHTEGTMVEVSARCSPAPAPPPLQHACSGVRAAPAMSQRSSSPSEVHRPPKHASRCLPYDRSLQIGRSSGVS